MDAVLEPYGGKSDPDYNFEERKYLGNASGEVHSDWTVWDV